MALCAAGGGQGGRTAVAERRAAAAWCVAAGSRLLGGAGVRHFCGACVLGAMQNMFYQSKSFNADIGLWDVSKVRKMVVRRRAL